MTSRVTSVKPRQPGLQVEASRQVETGHLSALDPGTSSPDYGPAAHGVPDELEMSRYSQPHRISGTVQGPADRVAPTAIRLTLGEGEKKTQDLRLR